MLVQVDELNIFVAIAQRKTQLIMLRFLMQKQLKFVLHAQQGYRLQNKYDFQFCVVR